MAFFQRVRSPHLSFIQTVVSLVLGGLSLMSSYWVVGQQKIPKPLCTPTKHSNCIAVPGASNSGSDQFSWDTGDDLFVFPTFHTGLFTNCQENIYTDAWEEKCHLFHTLTPANEKAILWLSVSMEIMYVGLLVISCALLSVQLCMITWFPTTQRWGQLLNSFAAVFTVLGGLLGMVAHMMFMQVFQTTASMGPESFKPHSYSFSWSFYVAWIAFTFCMAAGVSTLNNYTKKVLMVGPRRNSALNPCSFNYVVPPPPAPYYSPSSITLDYPQASPHISPLSPYYEPPLPPPRSSPPPLKHCHSLPLSFSASFPPPPSPPAPLSHFHRLSLASPTVSVHLPLPGPKDSRAPRYDPEDVYSPL